MSYWISEKIFSVCNTCNLLRRFRKAAIFFLMLCAVFLADFIGAGSYKFLKGYSWHSRKQAQFQESFKPIRVRSKIFHHGLTKKTVGKMQWEGRVLYPVYTNSLGLFDKSSREVSLAADKYRIVFIGDSFVEGMGVAYPNTFVGLLDAELSKKNIEVLNAGLVSYSPVIYWRKIKYLIEEVGLKFNELAVFLDISDPKNEMLDYYLDDRENVISRPTIEVGLMQPREAEVRSYRLDLFIKRNTILTYFLFEKIKNSFVRKMNTGLSIALWTTDGKLYKKYGEEGLSKMAFYMDRLYALCQKHRIKLTVAVYPWPDQIVNEDLRSIQVLYWKGWSDRTGVEFLDYFPYFVTGENKEEKRRVIEKYFIKGDQHWNAAGHQLIADVFLKYHAGSLRAAAER